MIDNVNLPAILKILPEEFIDRVRQSAHNAKMQRWAWGDDVLEVHTRMVQKQMPYSLLDAAWVIHLLIEGERSQNTLEDYALVARFFPPAVRAKYNHVDLPFSHFVFAASLQGPEPETGKPYWSVALQVSYSSYIDQGKNISVEALRRKLTPSLPALPDPTQPPIQYESQKPVPVTTASLPDAPQALPYIDPTQQAIERAVELAQEMRGLVPVIQRGNPTFASFVSNLVLGVLALHNKIDELPSGQS